MFGKSVLGVWIEKYGETAALEMWKERNKNISENIPRGENHWNYGLTGELSIFYGISIKDKWIKKFGFKKAEELEKERIKNSFVGNQTRNTRPCIKMKNILKDMGYTIIEEFAIYDEERKKWSFYDAYVKELNMLVEYVI